jgi:iodothyronine deiodinase-like protein
MYRRYGDHAEFVTVYIKEAHPEDEWQMASNEKENVCYPQPKTMAQRLAIANDFVRRFAYPVPLVVDPMDNRANQAYAGWPERIYIVDESGRIVYKGKPGPFGFHPEEADAWLRQRFPDVPAPAAAAAPAPS